MSVTLTGGSRSYESTVQLFKKMMAPNSSYAPLTDFALPKNIHGHITLDISIFKFAEPQSVLYAHKDKENLVLRLIVCEVDGHRDIGIPK